MNSRRVVQCRLTSTGLSLMINVRVAQVDDIPSLEPLMAMHHAETTKKMPYLPYDREVCMESMLGVLTNDGYLVLVAEVGSEIVGYFWLVALHPHYNSTIYVAEQFLFIHPTYRVAGRVFNALLREAKKASKSIGATFIQVGTLGGVERQERAYAKRFHKLGSIYHIPL